MSTPTADRYRYVFGEFTLDTNRGALLKGGVEVSLRPQSFEVLRILVVRQGSLVTRDELHQGVWGNKAVTDDSLSHCLIDIRKALGDTNRKIVRTVPRRGYIFEADVVLGEVDSTDVRLSEKSWVNDKTIVAVVASAAVAIVFIWQVVGDGLSGPLNRSIAVLPFVDISTGQDQQYLGDGLSEDILNSLAQHPELRVIARTSSFSFRSQMPDIATISESLNVAYVLEGSIRRVGDHLRITAQLIDTADSSHVWSQAFERRPQELLAVQRDIAEKILHHILPGSEQAVAMPAKRNVTANELMLLARHYELKVREQPEVDDDLIEEAIRLYREATIADPDSAVAQSRLAGALLYHGDRNAAEAPIFRALTLNPELSEVQTTLGSFYWTRGMRGAGAAWKRAIKLNPNNADALRSYGYWDWMQGRRDAPEGYFRRALDLDPLSLSRYADLGNYYAHEARIDETEDIIGRVEESFDSPAAYRVIARLLDLIGRVDQSIAWTIKARNLEPDNPLHTQALAELYVDVGDFETALNLEPEPGVGLLIKMRRYEDFIHVAEMLMINEPGDIHLRYLLAFAYNVTGRSANAVRVLRATGLPDIVMPEARQAMDIEAFVTLVDALDAAGETQRSRELATWWIERDHAQNSNWWIHLYSACTLAILDRNDEALVRLEKIAESPRLPWDYLIRDSRCFQRFDDEPRYQEMLRRVEDRRAAIRARLPAMLKEHRIAL